MASTRKVLVLAGAGMALAVPAAGAISFIDWGVEQQQRTAAKADRLFGKIGTPLAATAPTVANTSGAGSVRLASGLTVSAVLRGAASSTDATVKLGQNADMIAFWPTDTAPEWGIVCIEGAATGPGLQRIRLKEPGRGSVETIFTGTISCDGVRRTPWNTIFATEERVDGWGIEVYDPIETTNVSFDRTTGAATGGAHPANVVARPATGLYAWEGMAIYGDGTMYSGDELRPENDANGGAIFKYVPDHPAPNPMTPAAAATLSDPANAAVSPFAAGKIYALQIGSKGTATTFGQGNQLGQGKWVGPIADPLHTRAGAAELKATGYYRPEDMHPDPIALAAGSVRFCWTNTGVSELRSWGEVLCAEDRVDAAAPTGTTPEVQLFWAGNSKANQPDNLEFQPKTGIVYIIEDTPTVDGVPAPGDIWACLRDGADDDTMTDGCVRVASVTTAGAEPTGFIFDGSGTRAYLNIQHSPDNPGTTVFDEATFDEMLVIDGFRPDRAAAVR